MQLTPVLLFMMIFSFGLSSAQGMDEPKQIDSSQTNTVNLALEAKDINSFQAALDLYGSTNRQLIEKLTNAKNNVLELSNFYSKFNASGNLNDEKSKKVIAEYNNKYAGILGIIFNDIYSQKTEKLETSDKKLITILDKHINKYTNTESACFSINNEVAPKWCRKRQEECSTVYNLGATRGQLYFKQVNKVFDVNVIDYDPMTDSSKYTNSNGEETLAAKDDMLFCHLLAKSGKEFETHALVWDRDFNDNSINKLPTYTAYRQELVKINCIDTKPSSDDVVKLIALIDAYKNNEILKNLFGKYNTWYGNCNLSVKNYCKETYDIKNKIILSYTTVGCEVRDVTEADVKNDMTYMSTEAQRLNHSTILDSIHFCQQALDAGWFWSYDKPTLSAECTEKNEPAKKKKRTK